MKPLLMMAAAALLVTACAGTGGSKSAADAAEAASAINTVPVEGLPPQRLEPGPFPYTPLPLLPKRQV